MKLPISLLTVTLVISSFVAPADEPSFNPIFDGASLTGWRAGDPSYWSVEDGAITGRITKEHPCTINQYLVWEGGELADFELKLESRLNGNGAINNGFQFRSRELPDHDVCGYQMDNNLQTPWLVRLYDEYGRHDLALRGERATFDTDGNRTASPMPEAAGNAWFKLEDWHEYHLVCIGGHIALHVNGRLAAEIQDNDPRRAEPQGILALQLHSGPETFVQFRNIRLKVLKPAEKTSTKITEPEIKRNDLLANALAHWQLDSAGRGAKHPLTSVPQFYQLQLNVASTGAGARPNAKCVVLEGAYFDAGKELHADGEAVTAYLRARDPKGAWNSALFAKRGNHDKVHFNLFGAGLDNNGEGDIGFEVRTDNGFVMVSFPATQVDTTAWHDLVGRYDGKTLALFCDGKLMSSTPWSGALVKNDEPLLIAAETDNGNVVRHFHGELEDAALWARALSDEEIAALSFAPRH
ncbi:MAG: DUF1080 domain-containing protein [Candidatus Hydrogenedentes bacterium]|nr:DUF1080 domain-containing protein [Candidatus Hydrogenedentota bacterium]